MNEVRSRIECARKLPRHADNLRRGIGEINERKNRLDGLAHVYSFAAETPQRDELLLALAARRD